jgi:hypothetical protein
MSISSTADFGLYGVPADLQPYVSAAEQQFQTDCKTVAQNEKELGTPDLDVCSETNDTSSNNPVPVDAPQATYNSQS